MATDKVTHLYRELSANVLFRRGISKAVCPEIPILLHSQQNNHLACCMQAGTRTAFSMLMIAWVLCACSSMAWMQSVQQMGHWSRDELSTRYEEDWAYDALQAIGGWTDAHKDSNQYFHARFQLAVPDELIIRLFPCLPAMQAVSTALVCHVYGSSR